MLRSGPLASNPYPKALYVLTSVCMDQMMRKLVFASTFILAINYDTELPSAMQAVFFVPVIFSSGLVAPSRFVFLLFNYTTARAASTTPQYRRRGPRHVLDAVRS